MCTHNLNEAQHLCSRVAMINKGKILAMGSIHELTERLWKALPVEMEFLSSPSEAVIRSIREIDGVIIERVGEKPSCPQGFPKAPDSLR